MVYIEGYSSFDSDSPVPSSVGILTNCQHCFLYLLQVIDRNRLFFMLCNCMHLNEKRPSGAGVSEEAAKIMKIGPVERWN